MEELKLTFKTRNPAWWQKLMEMYWVNPKSWRLDEFILDNNQLTIKVQNGKMISGPIAEMKLRYQIDKFDRMEYFFTFGSQKLHFKEINYMLTTEEWQQIREILNRIKDRKKTKLGNFTDVLQSVTKVGKDIIGD